METLTIAYQPHIEAQLMNFLNSFQQQDLHIKTENKSYEDDPEFIAHRNRLHETVRRIKTGECKMYSIDELDTMLDQVIAKYEN